MEELQERMKAASLEMDVAETPGQEINAWLRWCRAFRKWEELNDAEEKTMQANARGYEL